MRKTYFVKIIDLRRRIFFWGGRNLFNITRVMLLNFMQIVSPIINLTSETYYYMIGGSNAQNF